MSKWKCDICNSEFNNYHAEGFNNKIYCPLCYYKHEYNDLKQQLSQLQQENEQLKADYGNKAQVERDILKQENIDLKQKMIRILENIDVSYNDWKKWKDELKDSDKNEKDSSI